MNDLYLAFPDQAAADAVLYHTATVRDYDRELTEEEQALGADNFAIKHIEVANYANIDTLGVLYERQEIIDPENPPEPIPLPGWHINIRLVEGEDAEPLQAYEVHPTVPRRVWA
jgi:hypothetical protein